VVTVMANSYGGLGADLTTMQGTRSRRCNHRTRLREQCLVKPVYFFRRPVGISSPG
jgi:hypothetical protein